MQSYLTLMRRDLAGYFLSLSGYVIIAATTFLVGLSFVVLLAKLGGDPSPMPVTEMFYRTQFFWLIPDPDHARDHDAPVRPGTVFRHVRNPDDHARAGRERRAGQVLGGADFYLVMWLPMLACLWVVQYYARQSGALELRMLASLYLGIGSAGRLFLRSGALPRRSRAARWWPRL
jgi:hypothetical protein